MRPLRIALICALATFPALASERPVALPKPAYHVLRRIPQDTIIPEIRQQRWPEQDQTLCLALAMYEEARGSKPKEWLAVAHVIHNRSKQDNASLCATIWAKHGSQFQWVKHPARLVPHEVEIWQDIQWAALDFVRREPADFTHGANMFYNPHKARPRWRHAGHVTLRMSHTFLRIKPPHPRGI